MRRKCAGLLLQALAFWTQAAPTLALRFNFTDVQQCDPIIITFAGSNLTSGVPDSLSIIPLNYSAINVPLPNPSVVSSGIALTFLPFPAGTNFVASLENSTGENIINVSDLIRVLPSTNGNSSCIPSTLSRQRHFEVVSTPSQCEEVTVAYNTSVVSEAPKVRLYSPNGPSFPLDLVTDNRKTGRATYLMKFFRGRQVIMVMDDSSVRESSPLLTVGGDSSSDNSCLKSFFNATIPTTVPATNDGINSRAVIIGSATGGTALLVLISCMALFIVRDRRRRQKGTSILFDPGKMTMPPDAENISASIPRFVIQNPPPGKNLAQSNPAYTNLSSPTKSGKERGSMASWSQVVPEDQRYPRPGQSQPPTKLQAGGVRAASSMDNMSIQSLDIERMLNMATLQTETLNGRKTSGVSFPSPMPSPKAYGGFNGGSGIEPPLLKPQGSRRHLRDPSDVPGSPSSVNPFDTGTLVVTNPGSNQYSSPLRPNRPPITGLPGSALDVLEQRDLADSGTTPEYYGIAR